MALSTNIPNAIIMVASDIRSISIPNMYITKMPKSITRGMNDPTIKPVLNPSSSMTTTRTMATLSTTLIIMPLTDFSTSSGW